MTEAGKCVTYKRNGDRAWLLNQRCLHSQTVQKEIKRGYGVSKKVL